MLIYLKACIAYASAGIPKKDMKLNKVVFWPFLRSLHMAQFLRFDIAIESVCLWLRVFLLCKSQQHTTP